MCDISNETSLVSSIVPHVRFLPQILSKYLADDLYLIVISHFLFEFFNLMRNNKHAASNFV